MQAIDRFMMVALTMSDSDHTVGNVELWGLLANGQSCASNHLEKRLGVGLSLLICCPTQCSLHFRHPSLSQDRGTMFEICESRIQG